MKTKAIIVGALVILFVSAGMMTAGVLKYREGQKALKIANEWLDESDARISVARGELEEMKQICRDIIAPPVYPDSGNDFSNKELPQ